MGFAIHWGKVVDPTCRITFLGIELDFENMMLRLPKDKLELLKLELQSFQTRKRASKRQLQSLAGRLSWAAGVVKGGRVFLRRIFDKISTLKRNSHKTIISLGVRKDIEWWSHFMQMFNGRSAVLDQQPIICAFTDACEDAAGASFGTDWLYFNWHTDWPEVAHFHINEKEVIAVTLAAQRWAPLWKNKRIIIHSDNSVTVASVNKGTSKNKVIMQCLRHLFWLSASFNFHLSCRYLPGIYNVAADSASRIHQPGHLARLWPFTAGTPLACHMSSKTLHFLLNRFPGCVPQS
ncbi:MAG: hypothetical protein AB2693_21555 [Candidatus Thiodiazotropha sp.]